MKMMSRRSDDQVYTTAQMKKQSVNRFGKAFGEAVNHAIIKYENCLTNAGNIDRSHREFVKSGCRIHSYENKYMRTMLYVVHLSPEDRNQVTNQINFQTRYPFSYKT